VLGHLHRSWTLLTSGWRIAWNDARASQRAAWASSRGVRAASSS